MAFPSYLGPRQRRSYRSPVSLFWAGAVAIVVFLLVAGGCSVYVQKSTERYVTFKVVDKERITECNDGDCSSKYLVYTDNGVYQNTDSLLYGKFRSSDLYGRLKRGQTYTCKVNGWRVGILSWYPNILKCEGI